MDSIIKKIQSSLVYSMVLFTLSGSLLMTACESRDYNTQSDQNFDNEESLPKSEIGDTTAPAGIRDDSTPAANPDLDNNPIIDKGMSSDSAMRDNSKIKK